MNYIAIDIGGTKIKYGLLNELGRIIDKSETITRITENDNFILDDVEKIIKNYMKSYKIEGVAISTAGVVDSKEGSITYAGKTIPNYIGVNFKKFIKDRFNLQCEIENDVNSAALGELWLGSARENKSICCITIGTGIGGALIIDRKLFKGSSNNAGELGYMNLGGEEIQNLASTTALVEAVSKRLDCNNIDGRFIFNNAKSGNIICIEEIDKIINIISDLIINLNYIVNPEVFVLGGGIMEQVEYIKPRLMEKIRLKANEKFFSKTTISFAKLGNVAGMVGALYHYIKINERKH